MIEENTQQSAPPTQTIFFQFRGNATEYFKIWIVNFFLSILTLGIYSAWAKVRRKRYFYGNTYLDNSSFEYLGDPIAILKGRLIAFFILALYVASGQFYAIFQLGFLILLIVIFPWLITRSLAFNALNSSYRNIRFHFHGKYKEAFKTFIGWAILIPFTMGLIYPLYIAKQKKFIVDNHAYGAAQFNLQEKIGQFYKAYLPVLILSGLFFITLIIAAIAIPTYLALQGQIPAQQFDQSTFAVFFITSFIILFYAIIIAIYAYLQARITNLVFNNTHFSGNSFKSTLRARTMIWLYFSNVFAIVFSIGLLTPWAAIRMARYRLQNLSLVVQGDLNNFMADMQKQISATGQEVGEMFDFDIAL